MDSIKLFLPIVKVDKEKRLVYGYATTETVDQAKEIIGYEASKKAFSAWQGNIREMHEPIAVGKAVDIIPDDEKKGIFVASYVSKGAQDTWEKVLDGTLRGYSIGGQVIRRVIETVKNGDTIESIPKVVDYKLTELSLVDNPCNTDCSVTLVKSVNDRLELTDVIIEKGETESGVKKSDVKTFSQRWEEAKLLLSLEGLQRVLGRTIEDILYGDGTSDDKEKAIRKAVKEFQVTVDEMVPGAARMFSRILDENLTDLLKDLKSKGGEDKVKNDLNKTLEELKGKVTNSDELKKAEEEAKKAEEAKKEEELKKSQEEEVKKAEEAKKAEEEAKKVEDEAKKAEELKKAEEVKKAEEEAKKSEESSIADRMTAVEEGIAKLTELVQAQVEKSADSTALEGIQKSVSDITDRVNKFLGEPAPRKTVVVEKKYETDDDEAKKAEELKKAEEVKKAEVNQEEVEKLVAKRKAGEILTAEEELKLEKVLDSMLESKVNKKK